jgi:ERCC4-type nuclease
MQQHNATAHRDDACLEITVDDRERARGVVERLGRLRDVAVSFDRLELGDYRAGDSLVVERKTLVDFALSVRDGRLFSQAHRLSRPDRPRSCLILEGRLGPSSRLPISRAAFQGALITVTLLFGLPILRSSSPGETAFLIVAAARQLERRRVRPHRRSGRRGGAIRRRQNLMLQAIPGVGPMRARDLLAVFGAPAAIALATHGDLTAVRGIGRDTAKRILLVFHHASSRELVSDRSTIAGSIC